MARRSRRNQNYRTTEKKTGNTLDECSQQFWCRLSPRHPRHPRPPRQAVLERPDREVYTASDNDEKLKSLARNAGIT